MQNQTVYSRFMKPELCLQMNIVGCVNYRPKTDACSRQRCRRRNLSGVQSTSDEAFDITPCHYQDACVLWWWRSAPRPNRCNRTNPGFVAPFSSQYRAGKVGWLQTRVMLCCVTAPLCVTPEKWKRVSESEERSGKEDDSPPASDGGTGRESGSRREHLNTIAHAHTHAHCTHRIGLYLDDKWRYNHTPHSPFTLLSGSGWKTIYFKLTKNKKLKSVSQHPWFSLPLPVLPPSSQPSLSLPLPCPLLLPICSFSFYWKEIKKIPSFQPTSFALLCLSRFRSTHSVNWQAGTAFSKDELCTPLSSFPVGFCPPWAPISTCGLSELCEYWGLSNSYPAFPVSQSLTFNNL